MKKDFILFIFVAGAAVVRLALYGYVGIKGLASFSMDTYAGIFINLGLYAFILLYAHKYFMQGKYTSLSPLIFKYGISDLATLLALRNGDERIFMLTATMVFLVPYVSDSPHASKKTLYLASAAVLGLSASVSALYIMRPAANYMATFGQAIYNLDALNPTIEWILIMALLLYKRMKQG